MFVRADLNVPLDGTSITDDGRIRASVPTLQRLRDAGARVVVAAHLGRPKPGADNSKYSLAPVAARLGELLGTDVTLAHLGGEAKAAVERLASGGVVLLENIRFDPRETSKDDAERAALARELAALAGTQGVFVSDGFGVVHRKQASVYDVARELPAYAGGLVLTEVEVLRRLTHDPQRPYVVVLGGSKVSDKLQVIESLLPKVDSLLVGGGMCFTFLAAQGLGVGDSLLEQDQIDNCRRLLESGKIVLPVDVVVADDFSAEANTRTVPVEKIPDGWKGLDIGPESVAAFAQVLASAKTVFWNGPMGVFELAPFAEGTRGVAEAIVDTTRARGTGRRVQRRRRRRLGRGRARARPARRRVLPHLDRRRRVAGVPGGQGPARYRRPGGGRRMSRRPLIAGNWKMNLTCRRRTTSSASSSANCPADLHQRVDVAVLPPFPLLAAVRAVLEHRRPVRHGRRAGPVAARQGRPHRRRVGADAVLGRLPLRRGRPLRAPHRPRRGRRAGARTRWRRRCGTASPRSSAWGRGSTSGRPGDHVEHTLAQVDAALDGVSADDAAGVVDRLRAGVGDRHGQGRHAGRRPGGVRGDPRSGSGRCTTTRSRSACGSSTAGR